MDVQKPASLQRKIALDIAFETKLPFLVSTLLIPKFSGNPLYTFIRFGTDDTTRQTIRQGNRWKWNEPKEIWIINTQAQAGKELEILMGGPGVELSGAEVTLSSLVNTSDTVIDPATEDKQTDILNAIQALQSASETLQDVIDAVGALQTGTETLQDIIDAVTALQSASETLQDVIDAVNNRIPKAATPTIYNVALTNADTEYSQALPSNTKRFSVHLRDYSEFRLAYESGKVATPTEPYLTIPAGSEHYQDGLDASGLTLFIASPAAGKVAEIEVWT